MKVWTRIIFLVLLAAAGSSAPALSKNDEAAMSLRDNVVRLHAEWSDGTTQDGFGIVVAERGGKAIIATANHVVRSNEAPAQAVSVWFFGDQGRRVVAEVLETSEPQLDIGVLEATLPNSVTWRKQAISGSVAQRGMQVWYVGRSGEWDVPVQPGVVSKVSSIRPEIQVEGLNITVGTSGAPLVDESGIVGMIVRDAPGVVTTAVRIEAINAIFNDDWNLPFNLVMAESSKQPQPPSKEIVIAVAGPMTGDYANFGEQLKRGAEQAVADLNANGGVLGGELRLVVGDDQCDPKQAMQIASDLVAEGIVFVDGHFCSGSTVSASEVYSEKQSVLQITPASTNPIVSDRGIKTIFRTSSRDDMQGTLAGTWLARHYEGQVAILTDESLYAEGLVREAVKALMANGAKRPLRVTYRQGDKDYSALVTKLKASRIAAVYVAGYHNDIGLLVRQAREQGFMSDFVGADALNNTEFLTIAGPAANGVRFSDARSLVNLKSAKEVVEKFRADNHEPDGYTLTSYAAVQAWAAAVAIAGTTDATKVAETLHASTIPTVIGDLSWDAKGDLTKGNYAWFIWDNDRAVEVP